MRRTILGLAAATVLLGGSSLPAAIENGGFESGLRGWARTSAVDVKSSKPKLGESGTWRPTEGNSFAYLATGLGKSVYTVLAQVFTAQAGDALSLDVFFDAGDCRCHNDDGFVNLLSLDTNRAVTLYQNSVAGVGCYGSDGWTTLVHTLAQTGTYMLTIGVRNVGDNRNHSGMGVDNVQLRSSVVPEMSGLAVWSLLGLCGAGLAARRRRG